MAHLTFDYEDRPDVVTHLYDLGVKAATAQRLKSVTMSANGEMIRKYTLSYSVSDSTGRSTLESVALYGSDNMSQLPPIHFQYGPVSNEWFSPDLVFHNGPDVKGVIARQCLEGDFNGDGRTDIACYTGQGGLWHVALSTGTNWNATYWDYGPQVKVPVSDQCFAADFSGDGKTDLACYTGSSGKWLVAISTGTGFRCAYWNGGPSPGIPVRNQCVAGEFGGPGRAAIACLVSGDTWHVALSNGSGWALSTDWHSGPAPFGPVGSNAASAMWMATEKPICCVVQETACGPWQDRWVHSGVQALGRARQKCQ